MHEGRGGDTTLALARPLRFVAQPSRLCRGFGGGTAEQLEQDAHWRPIAVAPLPMPIIRHVHLANLSRSARARR